MKNLTSEKRKEIGNRINELLESHCYTVMQFADEIDMAYHTVYRWTSGENIPQVEHLITLSDMFNVSIDWILKGGENNGTDSAIN